MKILGQTKSQAQVFLTKKKLSNSRHIHWIIAFVVAIGLGYLFILIEFVKMHDRNVLFYNLKTINLASKTQENKNVFDNNTPLFVIYNDKVIFGTIKSIVMPKLKKDSLILNKYSLKEDFKQKIETYKNTGYLFPAKTVGISFDNNLKYEEQLKIISDIYTLIKNENKQYSKESTAKAINPYIVFIDIMPSDI